MLPIIGAAVGGMVGGGIAVIIVWRKITGRRISAAQKEVEGLLAEAQTKYKETLLEAKEEGIKIKSQAKQEIRERRAELHRQERRISQKEENLDKKSEGIERRERGVVNKEKEIDSLRDQLQGLARLAFRKLDDAEHLQCVEMIRPMGEDLGIDALRFVQMALGMERECLREGLRHLERLAFRHRRRQHANPLAFGVKKRR